MSRGTKLTREDQERYTRIFMDLDKDRNGWLSRKEVGDWLRGAGHNMTDQQVEKIFRVIDKNADGKITLDEFYVAMDLIKKPRTS
ncbi:uncharacterized protein LOC143300456 [Babylonia areolata]|uniref:uncharacterized protein LOC143300456 n=1 Tax=Babylonia areolata TaxID=304850 RepID=UPI003FCFCA11